MTAHHSPRKLFGTGASLLLVAAAAAGAAKAQDLDGELLALCAAFAREHAEQSRLQALDEDTPEAVAAGDANYQRRCDAVEAITALPARTPEGVHAKALVARAVMENDAPGLGGPNHAGCATARAAGVVADERYSRQIGMSPILEIEASARELAGISACLWALATMAEHGKIKPQALVFLAQSIDGHAEALMALVESSDRPCLRPCV